MCTFIGCLVVDGDLLKDTHADGAKSTSDHYVSRLVFLFSCPQNPSINPFEFLLHKTNRLHFPVCVYHNRSQNTPQRVKNNSRHSTSSRVVFFCSLHAVTSSVIYYSTQVHTRKNVLYLLNIYIVV